MKIFQAIVFLAVLMLLPVQGICEVEGRAALDDKIGGIRLYHQPKVAIPAGWQVDEAAGQENECLVLIRKDEDINKPKTMIYAMARRKDTQKAPLASFVKGDIENFKKNNRNGLVKEVVPLHSAKGTLLTYNFTYKYESNNFVQTVAYAEEGDYFLTFTLTGKSASAHQKGLPDFKRVLESYK
jgi:hypothetical protein